MVSRLDHETYDLKVVSSSPGRVTVKPCIIQGIVPGILPHFFHLTQV